MTTYTNGYTNGLVKSSLAGVDAQVKELLKATEVLNAAVKTTVEEWTTTGSEGTLIGDTRIVLPT